jgi:serine/threonine-protein kinase
VFVPQLGGRSPRDAKFALERYGLRLGAINYASSDLYPQNTIMNQSAAPGKELAKGSAVDIVVSKGRAVDQTTVPDLIGRSVSEAERMLSDVGLKRGNITYQASTNLLPNTVVDQFPRAGDSLVRGAGVDLFVVREASSKEEQRGAERLE